ncbi:hypothetical protein [Nitrososphaera sp.]|uniref:hypothetical protein n=1 Tax=Nitrososphaera sp. TaxID=1971748 RepID=UPI00317DB804
MRSMANPGVLAIILASILISSVILASFQTVAHAQTPVKITVSKGVTSNGLYTLKAKFSNPRDSGYSLQSIEISLSKQDITKYKAPSGWMAKTRDGTVSFSTKAMRPGTSATFEISSPAPIFFFRWVVKSTDGAYTDWGVKDTNINWSSATIKRNYKWTFEGEEWTWDPAFSKALYDYYRYKDRPPTDYSVYVTDTYDDKMISSLVDSIREVAKERGWTEWQTINFVISFVQSLPYTSDSVTTAFDEYPRYPIETLVDNGGDCEDTSILAADLIQKLGYGAILINPPEHMAVGVYCTSCDGSYYEFEGRDYFYVETTGENWQIGELPEEYRGTTADLYPLTAKPTITFRWESELVDYSNSYATYKILITINNEGSAAAKNLKTWTAFDAQQAGKVWKQITTDPIDLEAGGTYYWEITLSPPRGKDTRLHIQVYGDNFSTIESTSKWFKT